MIVDWIWFGSNRHGQSPKENLYFGNITQFCLLIMY